MTLIQYEDEIVYTARLRGAGEPFERAGHRLLRAEVLGGNLIYVVHDGRILHRSMVRFEAPEMAFLQLPRHLPMVSRCHTEPEARGTGLFTAALRHIMWDLGRAGYALAALYTDRTNEACRRAAAHAGFVPCDRMRSVTLFERWRIQHSTVYGTMRLFLLPT